MERPEAPVAPGHVLAGKYRVDSVLGAGGMGVVVAAFHLQLAQKVALKFLLPNGLANAQVVARFEREARAAAQLRSEHVARVIDVGQLDEGRGPYIVMELLDGVDLGELLQRRGRFEQSEAVEYVLQACEAIAEAHSLGIVHRDLKPKNLFVTTRVDGSPLVKVLDFGISKTKSEDLSLTGTTEVIGSPNYMSPEQLKASRDVDARSDIWAIGAILYELLGGDVPFVAETLTQLCSMVLTEPPRPLDQLRPDVHPELRRVVDKCLQKDPTSRFANVGELAMALAPFATATGSLLASRVAVVAGSAKRVAHSDSLSSGRIAVPGQNTSVSWDRTELAKTGSRKPSIAIFAGAAVGLLVVAGIATTIFVTTGAKDPPIAAGSAASASVSATPTSATTTQPEVATATPTPSAPPTVAPAASSASAKPSAVAADIPAAKPPLKPAKPSIKPRSNGGDDLPMDRK